MCYVGLCRSLVKEGQIAIVFMEKLALTLTLAGGVSNLYDRMKRGYVVDYFSFQWKALKKVVFNLGDLFIFAGAFLMAAGTAAGFLKDLIMDLYGKTEEK